MTKLSLSQIEDSFKVEVVGMDYDDEELMCEDEIDETSYRNTYQRKEIRTKRKREDGELVGSGDVRKHRKF